MTKGEAIQVLQTALTAPFIYGNYAEALDMAIEALSDDTVSREFYEATINVNHGLAKENIELKEQIESAKQTELLQDGTLKVNVKSGAEVRRVLVWGDDGSGGLYYADDRPKLKQTDTMIIADGLRYLMKDEERHLSDRTRADALREQFLNYGAKMGGKK